MRALVGAALTIGACVLVACGGRAAAPPNNEPAAPAASAAAPAPASTTAAPQTLIPIKAAFSAFSMSQSPLTIAREAGYFAEEGLDVEIVHIPGSAQSTAAMVAGDVQYLTTGGVGVIRAKLGGTDLLLIAATKPYFAGSIMARPEITSPADLRGKRLAITNKGSNTDLMARAVLPRLGLIPDVDVTFLATGGEPQSVQALVAGNVDASSNTPPGDDRLRNLGMVTLFDITAARIPYPATAIAATSTTMTQRPDVTERYLRAYARAVHRYITDKEYVLALAVDLLRSDDRAANEQAYEIERGHMQANLELPLEAVQSTLDLIKGEDPRAVDAKPEEFVDLSIVHRLQQSGFFDRLTAEPPAR
ncbi:MAG: ABC transporter substrate-binding protein [Chloroflexi bacterium]|nr:ABC transporter substrate-binding protein [Chloroflexota bacterium]